MASAAPKMLPSGASNATSMAPVIVATVTAVISMSLSATSNGIRTLGAAGDNRPSGSTMMSLLMMPARICR